MKITLDKTIDAAYIYLTDIPYGGVAYTYPCDPASVGEINLDFDKSGLLLGIEVHNASKKLPKKILDKAIIIG